VQQSEGLRRDGAWEHAVLQQRAAGEAPVEELRLMSVTDACRRCAGMYSNVFATGCVACGAGESWMPQALHVMPAYPI
jgi:hypothetical protein